MPRTLLAFSLIASLLCGVLAQSPSPATPTTSPACTTLLLNGTQPFDVFLIGSPSASASSATPSPTLRLANTLVGGTAAVNGDAVLVNSLVGSSLNCSQASPTPSRSAVTLLVAGDINSTNSRVLCDELSLEVGENITQSIEFASIGEQLINRSNALCNASPDVQANVTNNILSLSLSADAKELTIVNVNASDLATLRILSVNASEPASNTTQRFVVINVFGSETSANATSQTTTNATAQGGLLLRNVGINLNGLNASQLLWNFCDATEISVQFMRILGSVLAPEAHLNLSNAGHQGTIVARSLEAAFTSQSSAPFGGFFCPNTNSTSSTEDEN